MRWPQDRTSWCHNSEWVGQCEGRFLEATLNIEVAGNDLPKCRDGWEPHKYISMDPNYIDPQLHFPLARSQKCSWPLQSPHIKGGGDTKEVGVKRLSNLNWLWLKYLTFANFPRTWQCEHMQRPHQAESWCWIYIQQRFEEVEVLVLKTSQAGQGEETPGIIVRETWAESQKWSR